MGPVLFLVIVFFFSDAGEEVGTIKPEILDLTSNH